MRSITRLRSPSLTGGRTATPHRRQHGDGRDDHREHKSCGINSHDTARGRRRRGHLQARAYLPGMLGMMATKRRRRPSRWPALAALSHPPQTSVCDGMGNTRLITGLASPFCCTTRSAPMTQNGARRQRVPSGNPTKAIGAGSHEATLSTSLPEPVVPAWPGLVVRARNLQVSTMILQSRLSRQSVSLAIELPRKCSFNCGLDIAGSYNFRHGCHQPPSPRCSRAFHAQAVVQCKP